MLNKHGSSINAGNLELTSTISIASLPTAEYRGVLPILSVTFISRFPSARIFLRSSTFLFLVETES